LLALIADSCWASRLTDITRVLGGACLLACWLGEIKEPGLVESGLEDEINGRRDGIDCFEGLSGQLLAGLLAGVLGCCMGSFQVLAGRLAGWNTFP